MISRATALATLLLAPAASAVDLDVLSSRDKKYYCSAYIYVGLYFQRESGAITGDQMETEMSRIVRIVMNGNGNYGFTQADRSFRKALDVISAENPSPEELSGMIGTCRSYLRL